MAATSEPADDIGDRSRLFMSRRLKRRAAAAAAASDAAPPPGTPSMGVASTGTTVHSPGSTKKLSPVLAARLHDISATYSPGTSMEAPSETSKWDMASQMGSAFEGRAGSVGDLDGVYGEIRMINTQLRAFRKHIPRLVAIVKKERESAALVVQRWWRGYRVRCRYTRTPLKRLTHAALAYSVQTARCLGLYASGNAVMKGGSNADTSKHVTRAVGMFQGEVSRSVRENFSLRGAGSGLSSDDAMMRELKRVSSRAAYVVNTASFVVTAAKGAEPESDTEVSVNGIRRDTSMMAGMTSFGGEVSISLEELEKQAVSEQCEGRTRRKGVTSPKKSKRRRRVHIDARQKRQLRGAGNVALVDHVGHVAVTQIGCGHEVFFQLVARLVQRIDLVVAQTAELNGIVYKQQKVLEELYEELGGVAAREQDRAARTIQTYWRRVHARRVRAAKHAHAMAVVTHGIDMVAVVKVQAAWRRKLAWKKAATMRAEQAEQHRATPAQVDHLIFAVEALMATVNEERSKRERLAQQLEAEKKARQEMEATVAGLVERMSGQRGDWPPVGGIAIARIKRTVTDPCGQSECEADDENNPLVEADMNPSSNSSEERGGTGGGGAMGSTGRSWRWKDVTGTEDESDSTDARQVDAGQARARRRPSRTPSRVNHVYDEGTDACAADVSSGVDTMDDDSKSFPMGGDEQVSKVDEPGPTHGVPPRAPQVPAAPSVLETEEVAHHDSDEDTYSYEFVEVEEDEQEEEEEEEQAA